eukprot:CAMPEP_0202862626 /NCGR_PEP_ID=MMETSP1391-20130828/3598_1 /ASSEMBLY_ACC=CAM_ASM_000867 /TAXON_ID=1034604 /ORGANISM="Chlamydomonas leiostraca, Strain SAG 11-49" /LENGTH=265 /DNA_ID=CAMNT_0049542183 /DNA_START=276 /DNA_END=1070 /DNA_ORIENTATION=+
MPKSIANLRVVTLMVTTWLACAATLRKNVVTTYDYLSLRSIASDMYTYKLHHNDQYNFFFFTAPPKLQHGPIFRGPHDFIDSHGMMMHDEVKFAAERVQESIAVNNGTCTAVDVGSNYGFFSMVAARLGCRVYCFEPDKKNFELAMLNFRINGLRNIVAFNKPAGGGIVSFDGWSSFSSNPSAQRIKALSLAAVSSVFLDGVVIDWLKIDVEGFENEVIKTVPSSLVVRSLSTEITWYLHPAYVNYNDTFQFIHSRFLNIVDVEW